MLVSFSNTCTGRNDVKLKENNRSEQLKTMIKVQLTFARFLESFYNKPPEDDELKGPIFYLLELQAYDRGILFASLNLPEGTGDAFREIKVAHSRHRRGRPGLPYGRYHRLQPSIFLAEKALPCRGCGKRGWVV